MNKNNKGYRRISFATWAILIGALFFVTNTNIISSQLVPSPQDVIRAFINIINNGYN